MNELVTAEDALLDAAKNALTVNGKLAVRVDLLPGDIRDPDVLRQIVGAAPAVYLAPLGGPVEGSSNNAMVRFNWSWLFVTNHAAGINQQNRGDARAPGAYDLMKFVIPKINGMTIPGVGTVKAKNVENLFSARSQQKGISMWAVPCSVLVPMDYELDEATLNAFITLHNTQQIGDANTTGLEGELTLPQ